MSDTSDDLHVMETLLSACRERLNDLNRAVKGKQWQRAASIATDYAGLLARLATVDASPAEREEMVQLDIRHRRCMRQLSRQMAAMSENIASLEEGKKAVQRSRDLTESIYRQ
ncbi:MAG: hypothetical protein COW18_09870 [Zetaproteobacteria bacterium CG12_big_fil_rev_8_21_14_0_65_54_13]|nr:MAG: hypothetical protein COX55_08265 [Zetaproteobacteria bacterium CG23_combo_of_CG06-09_8_20_14_all_54_7]PIW47064.1 MAG: hypothetical protein COW18_09870 [Zetaproteobacteria bacterium CG12_big_fil_rev_8_21_14_0_65_54_13]PIX53363.1 MAG: hypothetical protein COZ50_13640 [Zetaproteobacteria bacterium CG_4_10_14_3_um_filter_54_28]PJA30933.1 MAG: hypothetical protein CO188_01270 [Zetaproteobacteria bacterium CG_4_9_14_3_um_filter_54_145]